MRLLLVFVASVILSGFSSVISWAPQQSSTTRRSGAPSCIITTADATRENGAASAEASSSSFPSRRSFFGVLAGGALLATAASPAHALPMVTPEEFDVILRDSARSIDKVEFSGPKSETVVVRLVDGTAFGIKGVVESSTDPRSPLKIAAACKAYQVPARFVDLEGVLAASPRKKKMYTNARVLEAAAREEEKKLRLQQDEAIRQSELAQMRGGGGG